MTSFLYFIVAAVAYLLGSIPFGYVLVKFVRGQDIRLSGSGNIGATNVARSGTKGLGALTLLLDVLKGSAAVWIGKTIAVHYVRCSSSVIDSACPEQIRLVATAALFAVLGHVFPVWLKFKGGKGVATALGVFTFLFPMAIPVALLIFIIVVATSRYVSLGSILAAVAFPIAAYFFYRHYGYYDWISFLLAAGVSFLVILKHHQNIRRLIAGDENRFGSSKSSAEKQA